jgi:hypothetical protein
VVDTLLQRWPFVEGSERVAGEFNGLSFLSARGETADSPRAALARLSRAFGSKQAFALVAPGGDAAVFWQALGLQKLTAAQQAQMQQTLKEAALQSTVAAYRGSFPPLWAHDVLCTLDVLQWPTCSNPDPIALGVAVQRALPNLLWHAVTLQRRNGATHYVWTVWPEIDFGGLFAAAHPEERKALCRLAKFPRPAGAACPIVAGFETEATRARVEQVEHPMPADAARTLIRRELQASGWQEDTPENTGDFLQLRHAAGQQSLIVFVRPAQGGSTVTFLETGRP